MNEVLPFRCPVFRTDYLTKPCDKNLGRVAALKAKGFIDIGPLEQCTVCRGEKLEERNLKASRKINVFCPVHPEQRLESIKGGPPGPPISPETPEALPLPMITDIADIQTLHTCKKHLERPAKIDRLGRSMGLCEECLSERGRASGIKGQYARLTGPPVSIPLNQGKYAELKAWLEKQAAENERTLTQEIMYRLKMIMRLAGNI